MQTLRTKSRIAMILVIILVLLPCGFALYSMSQGEKDNMRSRIAHEVLEAHLELSRSGYLLINHVRSGGARYDVKGVKLEGKLMTQARRARLLIAQEIAVIGQGGAEEEEEELERIAQILASLNSNLSGNNDDRWVGLVDDAVDEERREVAGIDTLTQRAFRSASASMLIMTLVALAMTIGAFIWLQRSLLRPASDLLDGMTQLSKGDLSFRLRPSGDSEFQVLGEQFNKMAAQVQASAKSMENDRNALQLMVESRTEEIGAANAELKKSADTRTQFLADISHELRTPLAIIRGEAEVTLRGTDKEADEYRASLSRVADQVNGMARLVDDLLYVARNEGGAPKMKAQAVNVTSLLKTIANGLRPLVEADSGRLSFFSDIENARVIGDPDRLRQLIQILLDNAMNYSEGPPAIDITLCSAVDGFAIKIRDEGIGISREDLPHIFERYHRGKQASSQNGGGIGIGLPMAKAIADSHGGSITVESSEGAGTTITIILPGANEMKAVA